MEEIVEDADEINPPDSVERLATNNVDEAFKTPDVWKFPVTVDEAVEIKPAKLDNPLAVKFPEVTKLPEKIPKPADNPAIVEVPVTDRVEPRAVPPPTLKLEDARNNPATCKGAEIVDDAEEINPFPIVSIPVVEALAKLVFPATLNVPVAVIFATFVMSPER